tara:strand:- start:967 stop:1449 length:483 start_codon:yes stop_codon:yes gene_type:complete
MNQIINPSIGTSNNQLFREFIGYSDTSTIPSNSTLEYNNGNGTFNFTEPLNDLHIQDMIETTLGTAQLSSTHKNFVINVNLDQYTIFRLDVSADFFTLNSKSGTILINWESGQNIEYQDETRWRTTPLPRSLKSGESYMLNYIVNENLIKGSWHTLSNQS